MVLSSAKIIDLCSCWIEASIESSKPVQLLLVLGTEKAANSAYNRTFRGTPSSSVTPYLQASPSTSEIQQDSWGNGRMVIVMSKRSSSCLPCSNHQSTRHHCYCGSGSWWPEAGCAAVHCTRPAGHLTFSGSKHLRQSVEDEADQDLSMSLMLTLAHEELEWTNQCASSGSILNFIFTWVS